MGTYNIVYHQYLLWETQCKEVTVIAWKSFSSVAYFHMGLNTLACTPAYITLHKVRYGTFRYVLLLNKLHFLRKTGTYKGLQMRLDRPPKGIRFLKGLPDIQLEWFHTGISISDYQTVDPLTCKNSSPRTRISIGLRNFVDCFLSR